jgi:hypothetical protein
MRRRKLPHLKNPGHKPIREIIQHRGYFVAHAPNPWPIGQVIDMRNVGDTAGIPRDQRFAIVSETNLADYQEQCEFEGWKIVDPPPGPFFYRIGTD